MASSSSTSGQRSAAALMAEANKKAKSAGGFFSKMFPNSNNHADDARMLYVQAGNAGKTEGDYQTSVEAFKRALDLTTEDFEKAQLYENISSAYKMFDVPQAIPPLNKAAELHCSQGKFTMGAQTLERVAELHEQQGDRDKAVQCYETAYRYLIQENQKAAANRVLKKKAEAHVMLKQFMEAQTVYEQLAQNTKDDNMLRFGARDLWFRAILCSLCIDVDNAEISLSRYMQDNPLLDEKSLEIKLLRQIIQAFRDNSKEAYMKQLEDTPLSTIRSERVARFLVDEIGRKFDGDVDLK